MDDQSIGLQPATGRTLKVRITQRVIDRELAELRRTGGKEQRRYLADPDCGGLRLVLFPTGSSTWSYSYRPHGRGSAGRQLPQRTLRLGDLTTLTPAEARTRAEEAKALVRAGRDPVEEARAAAEQTRLERLRRVTVDTAFAQYVASGLGGGKLHQVHEESRLRLAIAEMAIGAAPMSDVSKADVLGLLDMHRTKPALAYVRFHALDRFLAWYGERDERFANPCKLVGKKFRPKRSPPRERVYSAPEAQSIWSGAEKFDDTRRDFIRLMILTALRRQEASELTLSNVDRGRRALVLFPNMTKNRSTFVLPLPPAAWAIVERRAGGLKAEERLFQMNSTGKAMGSWSQFTTRVRRRTGVLDFTFHDLRRLLMSEGAAHGIAALEVLDAALNHRRSATRSGVRLFYMHTDLMQAKTAAMAEWGKIVAHAVEHGRWLREDAEEASNVVPLRPAR